MALPGGKKIVVDGVEYTWIVKAEAKDRYQLGWTPPSLMLTTRNSADGKVFQYRCSSLLWEPEHASWFFDDVPSAVRPHKVPFTPAHVESIVRAKAFPFESGDWEVECA